MRALWEVEHGLNARSKLMHRRLGLTGPQRLLLRLVERLGPLTQGQLAHFLHVHPASVSRLVQTLNGRGLLTVTSDPGDRRQRIVTLGPRAWRALGPRDDTVEGAIRRALDGLKPREVARVLGVLGRISRELHVSALDRSGAGRR